MDMITFFDTLLSAQNPVLPNPAVMRVALHLSWAIVLGSGVLLMAGKLARTYRLGLSFLMIAWTLAPGAASPAYWLGLAFQAPSLMSTLICLTWFWGQAWQYKGVTVPKVEGQMTALTLLAAACVVLGWILLLDTLAWLPVSVYAWGFGSVALGAATVFATLLWAVPPTAAGVVTDRRLPSSLGLGLALSVLFLFVLTRLPTGNLWDALIDPWLWGALQLGWLVSVARRQLALRRAPATIRA